MSSFFSSDGSFSLQFAIIFIVIFVILAGVVFAFRRFTGKGMALSSKSGPRGRQPRLGIVDIYELDRQRQLILLRRDNVEHLLLVGGPNDVVIERNINRTMGARLPLEDASDEEVASENTPAVPYEPTPARAAPYLEPSFEMPVVVPTPPPGSEAPPVVGRPLGDVAANPRFEPVAPPEPVPAPRRAAARLAGAMRRAPPSLVNLVPGAAVMRAPGAEEKPAVPTLEPEAPAMPERPLVAPPASRAIDAAILSDMARQLEEALRRPAAAVRPAQQPSRGEPEIDPPSVAESSAEEPVPFAPEPHTSPVIEPEPEPIFETSAHDHPVDPVAAAMASAQDRPAHPEPSVHELSGHEPSTTDELFDEREASSESARPEPVREEPSAPVFVEAEPEPEPVATIPESPTPVLEQTAPVPEPQPASPPSKPASPNPFSVEEIEAEFARLLGRPLDRKN